METTENLQEKPNAEVDQPHDESHNKRPKKAKKAKKERKTDEEKRKKKRKKNVVSPEPPVVEAKPEPVETNVNANSFDDSKIIEETSHEQTKSINETTVEEGPEEDQNDAEVNAVSVPTEPVVDQPEPHESEEISGSMQATEVEVLDITSNDVDAPVISIPEQEAAVEPLVDSKSVKKNQVSPGDVSITSPRAKKNQVAPFDGIDARPTSAKSMRMGIRIHYLLF